MTGDDDLPWSAPWTVRRGPQDEAAFVADVSGALYVPDAAPEIRMIAEVMAVLDIPAQPGQGRTVAQLLTEERAQEQAKIIPLRRFAVGRRLAGVAAAAAIAVGVFTVSAYAGVLPDSIQKVAHSVLNAPSPKDDAPKPAHTPGTPGSTGGGAPNGGSASGGAGEQSGTTPGSPAGASAATPDASDPAPSSSADTPGPTAHPSKTPATGNGQTRGHNGQKSTSPPPAASLAATPSPTGSSRTPKTHG